MGVFTFCGLSGYITNLLPNNEYKSLIREGFHWILFGVSFAMVVTNQANFIAQILKLNPHESENIKLKNKLSKIEEKYKELENIVQQKSNRNDRDD